MSMRDEVKFGVAAIRAIPQAADVEARAVEEVLRLMLFVPTIPRRAMLVIRDAYAALAAMSGSDLTKPWQPFRHHFVHVHSRLVESVATGETDAGRPSPRA